MRQRAKALFVYDDKGRMLYVNEAVNPQLHPAPLLYVGCVAGGALLRVRSDVPDRVTAELRAALEALDGREAPSDDELLQGLRAILETHVPVRSVYAGPAYRFPDELPQTSEAVVIDRSNTGLLSAHFVELLEEIDVAQPFVVSTVEGRAVAVCRTVRRAGKLVEAGVHTAADHQRQGHGARRRGLGCTGSS